MLTGWIFKLALAVMLLALIAWILPARAQFGVYTLNGGTTSQINQTYTATQTDQSAIYVLNSGQLTLTTCIMNKTGDASNVNLSSQYGLNAGVLANSGGVVTIIGGSVTTNASGGNGLFATGSGSSITMSNGTIQASGGGAHGVDATYSGTINLVNVNITTTGANSSALATDFGGGTVNVTGGSIIASDSTPNSHSAGIYSTGSITVSNATVTSVADCGGVIDGANSINLINTALTGSVEGLKIWKTAPMVGTAMVTITGGSLTSTEGDGFYVTGETGNAATAAITVREGAVINAASGNIIKVLNASSASFTADGVSLSGNLVADATSSLTAYLYNSTILTGSLTTAALYMDASSQWNLTGNSNLTILSDSSGISGLNVLNIQGNGYDVHYDSSLTANRYLGGLTYTLVNGGVLTPGVVLAVNPEPAALTKTFALEQNYPNPFNPTTTINFQIATAGIVSMNVYDLTGRVVSTLVNGWRDAGYHQATFDGSNLATGVYLYRLTAGSNILTGKMALVK
jgi:hypothetical protein